MQSNAINLLCNISEKTQFLQNWNFSTFNKALPRRRSKTLHDLAPRHHQGQNQKNVLPKFNPPLKATNKADPILFVDSVINLKKKLKNKQKVSLRVVKNKLQHKKVLQSFVSKHESPEATTYNTVNLYEAVQINSPQIQNKEQTCAFSNSKIYESIHAAQSYESLMKRNNKHNRYFHSCLVSAQILKRKKSIVNCPLQIRKMRSDFQSKLHGLNRKPNDSNSNQKYSLNIEGQ